jgi:DNA repair protein SbcD/Mre11
VKIIHTGDWHIGKIVNEFSMIDDQRFVLEQLITIIKEEKPAALVIAGDLYDRSIPSVEAVELLDEVFTKVLLELKVPIIAIAGNHDSAERLSFGSKILTQNGLHIVGLFDKKVKSITLDNQEEKINFYMLPYADPKEVRHILQDEKILNHDDAMRTVVKAIEEKLNKNENNVLVAHGYVTLMSEEALDMENNEDNRRAGLETSASERPLSIGGTDLINGKYFSCFNYTALGHLHGPQKVGSDRIRYSGSILKYSFSEVNHKKGISIVQIDKEGKVTINHRELIPKRDMRIIKGPINELIKPEVYMKNNVEDYIYAILTDEEELMDPISKLRAVYPNIMGLHREDAMEKEDSKTSAAIGFQKKSKIKLFEEFYESITGKQLTDNKLNILKEIIETVEQEGNK